MKSIKVSHIVIIGAILLCAAVGAVLLYFGANEVDPAMPANALSSVVSNHTLMFPPQIEPGNVPADMPSGADGGSNEAAYTIDNERFGIDNTGSNARATTDGINAALQWAKEQGYDTVAFTEGTYLIQCLWRDRFVPPTDGILVPSGLTLDLGRAVFKMEPNSYPEYTIFAIVDQRDVTIKNGILIGDVEEHEFAPSKKSPTHEYGFGICISAGSDITIQGVTIQNMTGDGIIVEGSYTKLADGGHVSSNVRILDCSISQCRRQGISVVGVTGGEIARNSIRDIGGTAPSYGIVVMPSLDYVIEGVIIYDNVMDECAGGSIACNKGKNIEVYANACSSNIVVVSATDVQVYDNLIRDSYIEVIPGAKNVTVRDNILEGNSWLKLE